MHSHAEFIHVFTFQYQILHCENEANNDNMTQSLELNVILSQANIILQTLADPHIRQVFTRFGGLLLIRRMQCYHSAHGDL